MVNMRSTIGWAIGLLLCVAVGVAGGAALTADRRTPAREGATVNLDVAAANTIYAGGLVGIDSNGYVVPVSADSTIRVIGRAEEQVDNSSGSAGDETVDVGTGVYRYGNSSGADKFTLYNCPGHPVYAQDDQTVAYTDNSGARPQGGVCYEVDSDGVWVDFSRGYRNGALTNSAFANSAVSLEHLDSGITMSHLAGICNSIPSETDADATVTVTHEDIGANDYIFAAIKNSSVGEVNIANTVVTAGQVVFTLHENGGAGTTGHYCSFGAAQ